MHVVAVHTISDPDRFYSSVEAGMANMPAGLRVEALLPSPDRSRAVCLWEADSLEAVSSLVEDTVGDSSTNEFFAVDEGNAMGLPGRS
jgi:hypothetical protein